MFESFFLRTTCGDFPKLLYQVAADMFTLVLHWEPLSCGPNRGRDFEQIFYRYCDCRHLALSERAGSRTFRGFASNSGLNHESDAVIACPDISIHLELKFLTTEIQKNDLLIFNQKGMDFLLALPPGLRDKPLYRILLSGSTVSQEARIFALQWGITLIEPTSLPLLTLHELAGRNLSIHGHANETVQDRRRIEIARFIVPLQQRLEEVARAIKGQAQFPSAESCRRLIHQFQCEMGRQYWALLDHLNPTWTEDRYTVLAQRLFIDLRANSAGYLFDREVSP